MARTPAERGSPVSTDISPNASPGPRRVRTVVSPVALWRKTSTRPDLDDEQRVSWITLANDDGVRRAVSTLEELNDRRDLLRGMPRNSGLASSGAPLTASEQPRLTRETASAREPG